MLKTKTITTDKDTLLVVEMPEDNIFSAEKQIQAFIDSQNWIISLLSRDSDSNCKLKLLGRLPDITEEQWKGVVDDYDNGYFYYPDGYKDTCDTATESGLSLIQANEVYFENPLGEEPVIEEYFCGKKDFDDSDIEIFKNIHQQWVKAQKQVWDKARTHLFIKKK